jgi:NADPH-dependent ferric siderophore reductase
MLKKPGFVEAQLLKWLTREALVSRIETLSEHFRLIDLEGEALKDHAWAAGQKMQMQLGGFVSRTFTPILWDNDKGATRFLAYMHGEAPGARWARNLKANDNALIFGPRRSLDFEDVTPPLMLFGDETSFGLASSVAASGPGKTVFVFEVTSVEESETALATLGIAHATLIPRQTGDMHLTDVETALTQIVDAQAISNVALTGKATSIQRLGKALKARGLSSSQIRAKAYWAPGKTGLD